MTICESCGSGWQDGGGVRVPVDAATVDRAHCDAQHLGSALAGTPDRASQDIPPATARLVWHRDGGRCQTPGCRSARNLELHHIIHREHGGDHSPSNLTLRCSACHSAHHAGLLTIAGSAPSALTLTRAQDPTVAPATPTAHPGTIDVAAGVIADARAALSAAGWPAGVARTAVETARVRVGTADLVILIREALRSCLRSPGA